AFVLVGGCDAICPSYRDASVPPTGTLNVTGVTLSLPQPPHALSTATRLRTFWLRLPRLPTMLGVIGARWKFAGHVTTKISQAIFAGSPLLVLTGVTPQLNRLEEAGIFKSAENVGVLTARYQAGEPPRRHGKPPVVSAVIKLGKLDIAAAFKRRQA